MKARPASTAPKRKRLLGSRKVKANLEELLAKLEERLHPKITKAIAQSTDRFQTGVYKE